MRRSSQLEELRIRAARLVVRMIEGVSTVLRPEVSQLSPGDGGTGIPRLRFSRQPVGWCTFRVRRFSRCRIMRTRTRRRPRPCALRVKDFWSVRNAIFEQAPALCSQPEIIDKDYGGIGYQTVAFLSLVIGMRSGPGQFDLGRLLLEPPDGTYWCTTVARVRQMADRAESTPTTPEARREMFLNAVGGLLDGFPGVPPNTPILLATLFDTSLVYVTNELLAVPRAVGQVDLTKSLARQTPGSRRVSSRIELSKLVDDQLRAARVVSAGAASE